MHIPSIGRPLVLAALFSLPIYHTANALTPDKAEEAVLRFNSAFAGKLTTKQLTQMITDDFIEHHPTAGTPERTKAEFIARFAARSGAKRPPGTPPAPIVTMATDKYVLLMTPRPMTKPASDEKYEAFSFDLFRVTPDGKIAEHWDSWTLNDPMPGPPKKS